MKKSIYVLLVYMLSTIAFVSCSKKIRPETVAEQHTIYSYVPLDPLPVFEGGGRSCKVPHARFKDLLESLPDQAVRLAITQTDGKVSGSFSAVAIGGEKHSYQVILDYISVDAAQLPVYVQKFKISKTGVPTKLSLYDYTTSDSSRYKVTPAERINPYDRGSDTSAYKKDDAKGDLVVVPVYVGVGLRLTASIYVIKGTVSLSSLGALSAAAEAGQITGTLTVQTLGITGKSVSTSLPLPSEINPTTIQNAILSLGGIKAILHDEQSAVVEPRVVGFYNPIGNSQEITNGIISCLAEKPITWYRPCEINRDSLSKLQPSNSRPD